MFTKTKQLKFHRNEQSELKIYFRKYVFIDCQPTFVRNDTPLETIMNC